MIIIQDTSYILPGKRCACRSWKLPPHIPAFRDHEESRGISFIIISLEYYIFTDVLCRLYFLTLSPPLKR